MRKYFLLLLIYNLFACNKVTTYDIIIRNAIIYNGNGGVPFKGDIAINADTIAAIGDVQNSKAIDEIDARGMAVAPGFSNMMGHSEETLFQDSRALSDVKQGVTMEVFGESSFAPLNAKMKIQLQEGQGDIKYKVSWNTLGEYMNTLEKKGIFCWNWHDKAICARRR
jgi:N-acyl-D-amino-acid deacylase